MTLRGPHSASRAHPNDGCASLQLRRPLPAGIPFCSWYTPSSRRYTFFAAGTPLLQQVYPPPSGCTRLASSRYTSSYSGSTVHFTLHIAPMLPWEGTGSSSSMTPRGFPWCVTVQPRSCHCICLSVTVQLRSCHCNCHCVNVQLVTDKSVGCALPRRPVPAACPGPCPDPGQAGHLLQHLPGYPSL